MATPMLNASFIQAFNIVADVVNPNGLPPFTPQSAYVNTPKFIDAAGVAADSSTLEKSPVFYDLVDIKKNRVLYGIHVSKLRDLAGIKTYIAGAAYATGSIDDWVDPVDGYFYVYITSDYDNVATLQQLPYRIQAIRLTFGDFA